MAQNLTYYPGQKAAIVLEIYGTNMVPSSNFFKLVNVVSNNFSLIPDVALSFLTTSFILLNENASSVEYSFDGYTVHGELISSTPTQSLVFDNRAISNIWFRIKGTDPGSATVSVQAWSSPIEGILDRKNSLTPPIISRIIYPDLTLFANYPQYMTQIDIGLYLYNFILPTGGSAVGTYLVDVSYTDPNTGFLVKTIYQISIVAPYGNFSVTVG